VSYVIAYDIADDDTRLRLARLLEGWGRRGQRSVFECRLDPRDLPGLEGQIGDALKLWGERGAPGVSPG